MKNRKSWWIKLLRLYRLRLICVALVLTFIQPQVFKAASFFHDVCEEHWANVAISYVAERGYMPGNTMGYFNPDMPLDYFEVSQILARVAGFSHTGLTDLQRDYIENAYLRNRWALAPFEGHRLWNTAANREIAFLLERGILEADDLELFIATYYNEERQRNLSYEAAQMLLLRLKGENALDNLYYPFNPEHQISRAAFAVWLKNAVTNNSNGLVEQVETIMAVFEEYYSNTIRLTLPEGQSKYFTISDHVSVRIEGQLGSAAYLTEGMYILAVVLNDSELIVVQASAEPPEVIIGTYPTVTGTIHGIFINADAPHIILSSYEDNQLTIYPVNKATVDMYSLRLNSRVTILLYNMEVQSFTILSE